MIKAGQRVCVAGLPDITGVALEGPDDKGSFRVQFPQEQRRVCAREAERLDRKPDDFKTDLELVRRARQDAIRQGDPATARAMRDVEKVLLMQYSVA